MHLKGLFQENVVATSQMQWRNTFGCMQSLLHACFISKDMTAYEGKGHNDHQLWRIIQPGKSGEQNSVTQADSTDRQKNTQKAKMGTKALQSGLATCPLGRLTA